MPAIGMMAVSTAFLAGMVNAKDVFFRLHFSSRH
jgi:hypothetical protein